MNPEITTISSSLLLYRGELYSSMAVAKTEIPLLIVNGHKFWRIKDKVNWIENIRVEKCKEDSEMSYIIIVTFLKADLGDLLELRLVLKACRTAEITADFDENNFPISGAKYIIAKDTL